MQVIFWEDKQIFTEKCRKIPFFTEKNNFFFQKNGV